MQATQVPPLDLVGLEKKKKTGFRRLSNKLRKLVTPRTSQTSPRASLTGSKASTGDIASSNKQEQAGIAASSVQPVASIGTPSSDEWDSIPAIPVGQPGTASEASTAAQAADTRAAGAAHQEYQDEGQKEAAEGTAGALTARPLAEEPAQALAAGVEEVCAVIDASPEGNVAVEELAEEQPKEELAPAPAFIPREDPGLKFPAGTLVAAPAAGGWLTSVGKGSSHSQLMRSLLKAAAIVAAVAVASALGSKVATRRTSQASRLLSSAEAAAAGEAGRASKAKEDGGAAERG
ncbi:hypothetical protein N2152v2_008425 [Parachlorella kessleri]